jgi:hypothetical protein
MVERWPNGRRFCHRRTERTEIEGIDMTRPVIAVIEWQSNSGLEPAVWLGDSAEELRAAVARYLWPMAYDLGYITEEWVAEHPEPDYADPASVQAWLDELRGATTDAWLNIYTHGTEATSTTYHDIRR